MKHITLIIFTFLLLSCNNSSLQYFIKNEPVCTIYYKEIKETEVYFLNNKEFKQISNLLKKEYGASNIRLIINSKSKSAYYSEYYDAYNTIQCLLLSYDMKIISEEKIQFDYINKSKEASSNEYKE